MAISLTLGWIKHTERTLVHIHKHFNHYNENSHVKAGLPKYFCHVLSPFEIHLGSNLPFFCWQRFMERRNNLVTMSIGGYPGLHKCESKKKTTLTHLCSILEHREGKIVRAPQTRVQQKKQCFGSRYAYFQFWHFPIEVWHQMLPHIDCDFHTWRKKTKKELFFERVTVKNCMLYRWENLASNTSHWNPLNANMEIPTVILVSVFQFLNLNI